MWKMTQPALASVRFDVALLAFFSSLLQQQQQMRIMQEQPQQMAISAQHIIEPICFLFSNKL
jgi:hypothetical protein